MSRFLISFALIIAACGGGEGADPVGPSAATSTTALTATTTTTTTAPPATTTSTTSSIPTTTIPKDPDTVTQEQLLAVLATATDSYDSAGRYPTLEELTELGQPVTGDLDETGLTFVLSADTTLLLVGSSESGLGFCLLAEGDSLVYGTGIIPQGVDTVRECRGVGSPNPWS